MWCFFSSGRLATTELNALEHHREPEVSACIIDFALMAQNSGSHYRLLQDMNLQLSGVWLLTPQNLYFKF